MPDHVIKQLLCEQNFQVRCDNSRLITEVIEIKSARGTN